jgi:hypothetical protein
MSILVALDMLDDDPRLHKVLQEIAYLLTLPWQHITEALNPL